MRPDRRTLMISGSVGLAAAAVQAHGAVEDRRSALLGAWTLVDADTVYADGRLALWNNRPKPYQGLIIYLPQGLMSVQISAARPSRAASAPHLTDAEKAAYFDTYYGYFGRFDIEQAASVVTHHVVSSLLPHEIGVVYPRRYELSGDVLTLTTLQDANAPSGAKNRLVWRRQA